MKARLFIELLYTGEYVFSATTTNRGTSKGSTGGLFMHDTTEVNFGPTKYFISDEIHVRVSRNPLQYFKGPNGDEAHITHWAVLELAVYGVGVV